MSSKKSIPEMDSVREITEALNLEYSAEVAIHGVDANFSDLAAIRIPTTSFMLNLLLGGGVPSGRIMEIFGDPSKGKSTIVQHMMVGFQQYPGISILLDAESGWDRNRALRMGHISARHIHLQADTVELGFSVIHSTIRRMRMPGSKFPASMPIGIFWDTISASQTEGEKEADIYKDGMMDKARKIRRGLRTLSLLLPATNCSLVFVNQTIADPNGGSKFSKVQSKTTPGGGAVKFWSSKRLSVWSGGKLDIPFPNCGIVSNVKNIKDKLNKPYLEVSLPVIYETGVHPVYEVVNFLADNSTVLNVRKGYVYLTDYPETGNEFKLGRLKSLGETIQELPEVFDYLKFRAEEVWHDNFMPIS